MQFDIYGYEKVYKEPSVVRECAVCGKRIPIFWEKAEENRRSFCCTVHKQVFHKARAKKCSDTRLRLLERAIQGEPIPDTRSRQVLIDAGAIVHFKGEVYYITDTGWEIYDFLKWG